MSAAAAPADRGRVYTIAWVPGTDELLGTCHCGAARAGVDPVALWDWLTAHPERHEKSALKIPNTPIRSEPRALALKV